MVAGARALGEGAAGAGAGAGAHAVVADCVGPGARATGLVTEDDVGPGGLAGPGFGGRPALGPIGLGAEFDDTGAGVGAVDLLLSEAEVSLLFPSSDFLPRASIAANRDEGPPEAADGEVTCAI